MNKHGISPALRGNLLLLLTAFIWGVAFVAQKSGGEALGALTFNGARSFIGCAGLLAALPLLDRLGLSHPCESNAQRKALWLAGVLCGGALFAATNLQQLGLATTTVGKGGFITALYIVLVPVFGIFVGKKTTWLNWLGVIPAVAGLYLLCSPEGGSIRSGDLLLLGCAVMLSVHILIVDRVSAALDGVRLSCIQFLTVGVLNLPLMFAFEHPSLSAMADNWLPLLYAGLLSSGVAYTLQIIAQKDTHPIAASLLMSLESVFAVLAGWVLLGDKLSPSEWCGCALLFGAIILTQLPPPTKKEKNYG